MELCLMVHSTHDVMTMMSSLDTLETPGGQETEQVAGALAR